MNGSNYNEKFLRRVKSYSNFYVLGANCFAASCQHIPKTFRVRDQCNIDRCIKAMTELNLCS